MPYDVRKDFTAITLLVTQRLLVVVNTSVKANTVRELIALARARPGELNIGIANPSGAAALVAALFKINTNCRRNLRCSSTVSWKRTARWSRRLVLRPSDRSCVPACSRAMES